MGTEWPLTRVLSWEPWSALTFAGWLRSLVAVLAGTRVWYHFKRVHLLEQENQKLHLRLQTLSRALPEMVWLTASDGTATEDCPAWRALTGQAPEQMLGLGWMEVIHSDDRLAIRTAWHKASQTRAPFSVQYRALNREKRYRWLSTRFIPQSHDSRIGQWLAVTSDCTEQRQTRQQLENYTQWLRGAFYKSPIAAAIVVPRTLGFAQFNDALCHQLGYVRETLSQLSLFEIEDGCCRDQVVRRVRNLLTGSCRSFQTRHRTAGGGHLEIMVSGEPILLDGHRCIICTFIDITQHVQAQRILQENEHRFRLASEAMAGFIYDWDLPTNHVDRSAGTSEVIGLIPSDVGADAQAWYQRIHPDDLAHCRRMIQEAFEDSCGSYHLEYRVRHHGGAYIHVSDRGRIVRDRYGRPLRVVGGITDISRRKRTEAEMVKARHEAEHARAAAEAANSAKDRLLAALSHELRTPLTPVMTLAQMMEHDPSLGAETQEHLAMIRRNVELEVRLIDDLLDLTRLSRGTPLLQLGVVDIHRVLRQVYQMCQSELATKSIALTLQLESPHALISGDASRIQQALWNLIRNSIKFTPENGSIAIRTEVQPKNHIALTICDSGVGIAADDLPRIFDPFERGNESSVRQFGGLGVGLAVSRAIVQMHGGTIHARSEGPGKGSTFTIVLPLATRSRSVESTDRLLRGRQLRILLVEDHGDTSRVMIKLLRKEGYQVEHAESVRQALSAASSTHFDLLVSDLGLPDGTGQELMRQLKNSYGLRGIALSGYSTDEDIRSSLDAGFAAHLTKPVNLDRLRVALHELADPPRPAATL